MRQWKKFAHINGNCQWDALSSYHIRIVNQHILIRNCKDWQHFNTNLTYQFPRAKTIILSNNNKEFVRFLLMDKNRFPSLQHCFLYDCYNSYSPAILHPFESSFHKKLYLPSHQSLFKEQWDRDNVIHLQSTTSVYKTLNYATQNKEPLIMGQE